MYSVRKVVDLYVFFKSGGKTVSKTWKLLLNSRMQDEITV